MIRRFHPGREDGFALPLTIMVLAIITVMLAAVFVRVQADRRVAESSGDMVDALTIAEIGLYQYLDYYSGLNTRPSDGDSLEFTGISPGGKASVVAHVVRNPADTLSPQLYIVRSTGVRIIPALGAEPQASRTIAQFAQWQSGTIDILGAYTAANKFKLPVGPAGAVDIRGVDQCAGSPAPTVTGLYTRVAGTDLTSPDVNPAPILSGAAAAVADTTDIDWNAVLGGGFEPDYTALPASPATGWASYLINGNLTISTPYIGNGLLVITGDLATTGALFRWDGVIVLGGKFDPDATVTNINGALVSGLIHQNPGPGPGDGEVGGPTTLLWIFYHSCNVFDAMASLTGFVAIPNAWVDNWATY